ncbi:MAG: NfeD family protein [Thermoplasmatota archaeon]
MISWLLILYLVIGGMSLLVLIAMLIFGGFDLDMDVGPDVDMDLPLDIDVDFDAGGPGLSLPIMLAFLAMLGGIGAILTFFDFNPIITPFIAAVGSLFLAVILFLVLSYFLKTFSSDSTVKYRTLIGKEASVNIAIGKGSEGQIVLFTEQRGRTLIPAVSDRAIPSNASVMIVGVQGDTVKVLPKAVYNKMKKKKRIKKK